MQAVGVDVHPLRARRENLDGPALGPEELLLRLDQFIPRGQAKRMGYRKVRPEATVSLHILRNDHRVVSEDATILCAVDGLE